MIRDDIISFYDGLTHEQRLAQCITMTRIAYEKLSSMSLDMPNGMDRFEEFCRDPTNGELETEIFNAAFDYQTATETAASRAYTLMAVMISQTNNITYKSSYKSTKFSYEAVMHVCAMLFNALLDPRVTSPDRINIEKFNQELRLRDDGYAMAFNILKDMK